MPLLIVSLDNTVLNVVLPTLVRKLHASTSELQWIVDAYALAFGGLMLVAGSLADRVGRKRTFIAGLLMFAATSGLAAASGSVETLIGARVGMGAGGALIMPSTLSIITNTFSDADERQRALGFWSGTSGAGVALGPIVGGLLLAHFWWGSVFLINVPFALLGALIALPLVPESRDPHSQALDTAGSLLSIAGVGVLLWGIIEAPVHGWSSAVVIGAGAGGVALLGGFVVWERRTAHPMLSLHYFAERRFSSAVSSNGLLAFGLFGAMFVLTQLLQFHLGYTPLQAGVRVLPAAGAIALVAPLSSLLVGRFGRKLIVACGMFLAAAGLWQISGASVASGYTAVLPGMVLLGMGAGLALPSATASVVGSLPSEHTGVGSAANGSFMQVGGAVGVAVIGSLLSTRYQSRMDAAIRPFDVPHATAELIRGSLGGATQVARHLGGTLGQLLSRTAHSAFVSGMDLGLGVASFVVLGAVLLALLALPARDRARARQAR